MRTMDRTAIDQFGIPEELLMENAGHAAYVVLAREVGLANKTFLVFCGIGNNGGDGVVVARKLHADGVTVKIYILGDPGAYRGAAKLNLDILLRLPIAVQQLASLDTLEPEVAQCNAIVDAIFGTGLTREVTGLHRDVIDVINDSDKTVLSLDIPSGVHGDTGRILGTA